MKKNKIKGLAALTVIALTALIAGLTSCQAAQKTVDKAAEWGASRVNGQNVTANLSLPTEYEANKNVKLIWTSDTPEALSNDGVFTAPGEDASVKLTCKAEYKKKSASRDATVTVKAAELPIDNPSPENQSSGQNGGQTPYGGVPDSRPNGFGADVNQDGIIDGADGIDADNNGIIDGADGMDENGSPVRRLPFRRPRGAGGRRRFGNGEGYFRNGYNRDANDSDQNAGDFDQNAGGNNGENGFDQSASGYNKDASGYRRRPSTRPAPIEQNGNEPKGSQG
ncbi:MAG: hypothetical protein LBQ40_01285 [Clostridiales bacterium]|jgi:hypothetical protein|nr:hypothetical protein [Clostridiales bacterium]